MHGDFSGWGVGKVAWLRAGTEERLPASLQALLLRVASASSNRALLASLRQAIAGHEETVGPKLIHVLVPLDAVASLLASLRPLLPPDVAHRLDATLAGSKEYHVTLWHCNGNGHPPGVPEELVAMEGREVSLRVLALASDNVATAVKVEIVRDDEGTGSEVEDDGGSSRTATVPCFNLHPHITLWSLPGQAKHSNALLSGDGAAARRHLHAEAASSAREEEEGSASRLGASDRDPSLGDHGRGDECMGDGGGAAGCGGGGEAGLEEEEFHVDLSVVRGDGRDTLSMDLRGRVTRVEWA
ncbi:hypothetical protein T484DRAFT_1856179 [Baffinella frigidus]|nr:hypothetical protein T484DRAFT_1856179 [Cryptophyta sp. CCMP2293]